LQPHQSLPDTWSNNHDSRAGHAPGKKQYGEKKTRKHNTGEKQYEKNNTGKIHRGKNNTETNNTEKKLSKKSAKKIRKNPKKYDKTQYGGKTIRKQAIRVNKLSKQSHLQSL